MQKAIHPIRNELQRYKNILIMERKSVILHKKEGTLQF